MFQFKNSEHPFTTFIIVAILFACVAFTLSGCGLIVKRQIRKIKRNCCTEVVVFVQQGCQPCIEAKVKLDNAGVKVRYVEANCYNRALVKQFGITKVPAFFLRYPNGYVRIQSVDGILRLCKRS